MTLSGLTIANGNGAAGSMSNSGTLSVTNSSFSGNSGTFWAGGIFSMGTLTVTDSTFSGNSSPGNSGGVSKIWAH